MSKKKRFAMLRNNMSQLITKQDINGRPFWIVPSVMAKCDFVMNAVLYTKLCFEESLAQWNGRPVVVTHPMEDNHPTTANDADFFATHEIGRIFEARIEGGLLKADLHIDVEKSQNMDLGKIVLALLEAESPLDNSTGMFVTEGIDAEGEKDSRAYNFIASKIVPDHLAILITEEGAASQKDGVGIPRINRAMQQLYPAGAVLRTNAEALFCAMEKALGCTAWDVYPAVRLHEIYPTYVIYTTQQEVSADRKFKRCSYVASGDNVTLMDDTVEVSLEWVPVYKEIFTMNKKLEKLVANGVITKEQAEALSKAGDGAVDVFVANHEQMETALKDAGTAREALKANEQGKQEAELTANKLQQRVEVLEKAEQEHITNEKTKLIPTILTNAKDIYTEAELVCMSIEQLQKVHTLAVNAAKAQAKTVAEEEPAFHMPLQANSASGPSVEALADVSVDL